MPPKLSQPTRFGKRAKKRSFFWPECPDTNYYRIIEALWQTSHMTNKNSFLDGAQQEWTSKYKDDSTARKLLLAKADKIASDDSELTKAFVHSIPAAESNVDVTVVSAVSGTSASTSAAKTAPRQISMIEKLLARLKVDQSKFLTEDITSKVALMSLMDEVSQLWLRFESHRSCYLRLVSNRRRNWSKLSSCMSSVDSDLSSLDKLLQYGPSIFSFRFRGGGS